MFDDEDEDEGRVGDSDDEEAKEEDNKQVQIGHNDICDDAAADAEHN